MKKDSWTSSPTNSTRQGPSWSCTALDSLSSSTGRGCHGKSRHSGSLRISTRPCRVIMWPSVSNRISVGIPKVEKDTAISLLQNTPSNSFLYWTIHVLISFGHFMKAFCFKLENYEIRLSFGKPISERYFECKYIVTKSVASNAEHSYKGHTHTRPDGLWSVISVVHTQPLFGDRNLPAVLVVLSHTQTSGSRER